MNSSEVNSYLNSFVNFESQLHQLRPDAFNLDRIKKFLALAGNPQEHLKIIHVAGTKGKGSTCAFLASILQQAGYSVGLYTSPHLHRVNERIRILNKENLREEDFFSGSIDDRALADVLGQLQPLAAAIQNEGSLLTYFEVLTVAALAYFAHCKVDVVILETGLGGRLDATNAAASLIAVITAISLDHVNILGASLSKIASEKAGIIKDSSQKVVIAPQERQALDVIVDRCHEFGISPVLVSAEKYEDLHVGLKGRHQLINAATAVETIKILQTMGFKISNEAISGGLKDVRWPGRFELLQKNPDVIVDCAHNEASAQALSETLAEIYSQRRVILILGISQDKDAAAMTHALKENVAEVFLTKANHPRARIFNETEGKDYFGDKFLGITEDLTQALKKALQMAEPQDVIVITGSVFIVAEATDILNKAS